MIATVENPAIPAGNESADAAISNARINDIKQTRVLFFAGDVFSATEKYRSPATMGFGGISRSDIQTIQHGGNRGIIYKCKFTTMQEKMIHENKEFLNPQDIKNWEPSYILEKGKLGPNGWEDVQVGGGKDNAYLVYKKRYPGEEMRFALEVNQPNGEGGITEIVALKGAKYPEIRQAQLFFFPEWAEIERGEASLPATLSALEAHIRSRIAAARELDPDTANRYGAIGNDMLRSCAAYRQWGLRYLKYNEDAINSAKTRGDDYSYPELAELVLVQLEQKRKDDLISGEHSSTNQLVAEMRAERAEKNDLLKRQLELEERKLRLEEIKLGIRQPNVEDVVPIATPEAIHLDEVTDETVVETTELGAIGDTIDTPNGKAEIIGKPFGRIKVRLEDGTETMLDKL